jgi:hypothetical protein
MLRVCLHAQLVLHYPANPSCCAVTCLSPAVATDEVQQVAWLTPKLCVCMCCCLCTLCRYVDTPLVRTMLQHQPKVAQEMMGPLYGQSLLQPQQVVDLAITVMQQPLPQKGAMVPFRQAYAGAGCVWLLLQDGRSLDPFAANPSHKALAGARVASIGAGSSSSSSRARSQQPKNPMAAASAASMARFGSAAALAAFAQQRLPQSYQKLQVSRLTPKFREAVQTVTVGMPAVPAGIPAGQVLVRRLFVGINASDINYTSGRCVGLFLGLSATACMP